MSGTYEISLSSPKQSPTNSFKRKSSLVRKPDLLNRVYEQEVLMRWVNHVLERSIESPDSLDFSDGVCLIKLVDKLAHTNKTIQTHSTPILQFQKHHNYQNMLDFLRNQAGAKLPSEINADGLLLSDVQMQYKLVWELITHYKLQSSKELLLDWVNKLVPKMKVKNFEADWCDGIVLFSFVNAIVKGNNPDSCPSSTLSPQNLISSAVATAKEILSIPPILLDTIPLNMYSSSKPLLAYLSCFLRPYFSNIKRWLHNILPGKKIADFQTCWSNGHLLALLLDKVHPGLSKDILKCCTHKVLSTDLQLNNVTELIRRTKKTLCVKIQLEPSALVNRTAEPLLVAMFLDDIRQYSLVQRPFRRQITVQTSDYETASMDSYSTNSVCRTFSEASMSYADPASNRYRVKHRSKSFESLDKIQTVARLENSTSLSSINKPDASSETPFDRKCVERLSSVSLMAHREKLAHNIPTHLTYSIDHFLESGESKNTQVDAGIREVPMTIGPQLEKGGQSSKLVKKRSNRCCMTVSLVLVLIISVLFFLIVGAGSAIVFCTVGHHCGRF